MAMSDPADDDVVGTPIPAADVARYLKLLDYLDPVAALGRLEKYALWIFGSSGTLSTIVAALSLGGVVPRTPLARIIIVVAVLAITLSMVLVVRSLTPHADIFKPHQPQQVAAVISDELERRTPLLRMASISFAAALVLASLSGFTAWYESRSAAGQTLSYSVRPGLAGTSSVDARLTAHGLPVGASIRIELDSGAGAPLAVAGGVASDSGIADASLAAMQLTGPRSTCMRLYAHALRDTTIEIFKPCPK